ncbi:hypothetical protein ACFL6C_00780, partial [Myxococcota bacterium]
MTLIKENRHIAPLLALVVTGCASDTIILRKGLTGIDLTVQHGNAGELDQLQIEITLTTGEPVLEPVARPDPPKPLPGLQNSVVILLPHELGGQEVVLRVHGLWQGAIVASAQEPVELVAKQLVGFTIQLGELFCRNGLDDDGDGLIDGADPGCQSEDDTDEHGDDVCDNGLDDDRDGRADYLANGDGDEACLSPTGDTELNGTPCNDGNDNDGDGRTDFRVDGTGDPGCTDPLEFSERGDTACDNGADDDGDGAADYVSGDDGDPGCDRPEDDDEHGSVDCD